MMPGSDMGEQPAPARRQALQGRDRVGGRAHCDNTFATPVDLGGEWFLFVRPRADGKPGTNDPLFDIAETPQFKPRVRAKPDLFNRAFYRNHRPVPFDDPDQLDVGLTYLAMLEAIDEAGAAASQGKAPEISGAGDRAVGA